MGKHKRDKVGRALRDNPTGGGGRATLGDQIHSERFVKPKDEGDEEGEEDIKISSADPEVIHNER